VKTVRQGTNKGNKVNERDDKFYGRKERDSDLYNEITCLIQRSADNAVDKEVRLISLIR
jgi:hypothetical protein